MTRILCITGTDTDVGKTVATAALACVYGQVGTVAVDKPLQTGVSGQAPGDAEEVRRLSAITHAQAGIRLGPAMAPVQAARRCGQSLPEAGVHVERIAALARHHDTVLVEGSGGLLVQLDEHGHTLADLAQALRDLLTLLEGPDTGAAPETVEVIVVARPGLGTLNHTALTVEALRQRGLPVRGVILGSWPEQPSPVEHDNRAHLQALDVPYLGEIPTGAPELDPAEFRAQAPAWLAGLTAS